MAWVDNVSGDIVTSSTKVGALKIWNAAHESNKDMIKVGPHGIHHIEPVRGQMSTFLLHLKNGECAIFNVRKKKLIF